MSSARDEILARIRTALRDAVPAAEDVPRGYRRATDAPAGSVRDLFIERAGDYSAEVRRAAAVQNDVSAACARHGAKRVAVPAGLPGAWRPDGVELIEDRGMSHAEIAATDGVITGCAVAIAETGTVVLDGGADQGRRALTLLPDLHICLVPAERIVSSVPEAIARLGPERRPVTFISGPSATSDIELSRVEGVHGPRRLELLVIG